MSGISLKGKVAIVTGGSSGIGRATALKFAGEGAKVVVADVGIKGGEGTVKQIQEMGGEAVFVKTDVTQATEVKNLIQTAVSTYGRLDCAANNAGITGVPSPVDEVTEENWQATIDINLKGIWLCMKYEIPQMLKNGGGAIVNTASIVSVIGFRASSPYSASKHGVLGLTKSAALEYATEGIRINAVSPGFISTPIVDDLLRLDAQIESQMIALTPMGRMGKSEEIAEAIVWLCSYKASFVTGHNLVVDGGVIIQ